MRLPLVAPIMSRDGTLTKGSKLVNMYMESENGRVENYSRPGISTTASSISGVGAGLYNDGTSLFTMNNSVLGVVTLSSSVYSHASVSTLNNTANLVVDFLRNEGNTSTFIKTTVSAYAYK